MFWYALITTHNFKVSLVLHWVFKYLLECGSGDAVCFSLSDKTSVQVWRHCHGHPNSGNVAKEADSVKMFKTYFFSYFETLLLPRFFFFFPMIRLISQFSSMASSFANAAWLGRLLGIYVHPVLLFLIRETLPLPPRQSQKGRLCFHLWGLLPSPHLPACDPLSQK